MSSLQISIPPSSSSKRTSTTIIATASSDGKIHIYDFAQVGSDTSSAGKVQEVEPVTVYDSKGTRLTCVALADDVAAPTPAVKAGKNGKRDRDEDEDSEAEGDEDVDMYGSGEEEEEEEDRENEEEEEEEEEMESE